MNTITSPYSDQAHLYHADIEVRTGLDFQLKQQMPRFWFGGNPFKTRIFDALSLTFPVGERYFIGSVRLFRERISDEALKTRVADFIKQEAQHGIAHDKMNAVMLSQGMPLEPMIELAEKVLGWRLKNYSPEFNIAFTAACEHLTALMADCFYSKKQVMADANPYVRAMFAWHAIEEMEHRDVAFDVMQDVAQVSYPLRAFALVLASAEMSFFTLYRLNLMLKADGFDRRSRFKLFREGLPWVWAKHGVLSASSKPYRAWFRRNFHPSQHPVIAQYPVWLNTLKETGDPVKAGEAFWAAGQ